MPKIQPKPLIWVIISIIGLSGCKKENLTSIKIHEKELLLFWERAPKPCQGKLPFCYQAYRFRKNEGLLNQEQQIMNIHIRGAMYIFTPVSTPDEPNKKYRILSEKITQESFQNWFKKHVAPGFVREDNFFKADMIFQRDNVWHIRGAKLLYSKCDLNIHLKYKEHPFIFVFLWDVKNLNDRNIIPKIELHSLEKFEASLSIRRFSDETQGI